VKAQPAVVVHRDGPVAVLTLARPDRANAMDDEITDGLLDELGALSGDADVRAVVLTGTGEVFSAGGDFTTIRLMQTDRALRDSMLAAHHKLFRVITGMPFPSVAAVNGPAVGAGATLALLCDLVVMADEAYLSDPRVSLGLVDGAGGFVLWPLLTGLSAAKEHLLLGDQVSSAQALRLGLANRVVPTADTLPQALRLAHRLAEQPPHAVRQAKRLLNHPLRTAVGLLEESRRVETECFDTEEHRRRLDELSARVTAKAKAGNP
jgi:enoyl-CoA hydratase